jgi:hypothetical protein
MKSRMRLSQSWSSLMLMLVEKERLARLMPFSDSGVITRYTQGAPIRNKSLWPVTWLTLGRLLRIWITSKMKV